jgi:hypothetical protein
VEIKKTVVPNPSTLFSVELFELVGLSVYYKIYCIQNVQHYGIVDENLSDKIGPCFFLFKETVSRDFRPQFVFINRWPLGP